MGFCNLCLYWNLIYTSYWLKNKKPLTQRDLQLIHSVLTVFNIYLEKDFYSTNGNPSPSGENFYELSLEWPSGPEMGRKLSQEKHSYELKARRWVGKIVNTRAWINLLPGLIIKIVRVSTNWFWKNKIKNKLFLGCNDTRWLFLEQWCKVHPVIHCREHHYGLGLVWWHYICKRTYFYKFIQLPKDAKVADLITYCHWNQ